MIDFNKDEKQKMIESIRHYFQEEMDEEIGDLKGMLMLDFFLQEIGPSVYNKAIADAARYIQERAVDMDGSCFEPEFSYWIDKKKNR